MSQDLKIILTPKADTSSKTVEQLNQQIKSLEKKLNSLNLKTNIDASALLTLTKNISNASIKQLKKAQRLPEMLMALLISNKLNTYPLSFFYFEGGLYLIIGLQKSKQEYVTILKR
ncbi:hypothetical protein HRF58_09325 [Bacillus velezensis]|uniref:hypothetical protein n=1 Tax=Bacillus sp. EU55 TaxID=2975343 RepID=UPI0013315B87|nr:MULTISPECIES: hypothetical protein [Bacillus amyloliquefaciens group]NRF34909.1 hypothetical protein [Bacillus velezensis]